MKQKKKSNNSLPSISNPFVIGILGWVVAVGDRSVATAMKNSGLTLLPHFDTEIKGILGGIYARPANVVYGE